MIRELVTIKDKDWSINLEDEAFAEHPEELIQEAVHAVQITAAGHYVNLVTHKSAGHPEFGLIDQLREALTESGILNVDLVYIDECGCGGFVTRAYRL